MKIIFAVIGAACIYFLQAVLYKKLWKKNLTVSMEFEQYAVTEKEEGELREMIMNQKFLPLPVLQVKFAADRHLDFKQEGNIAVTDRCYKRDVFSVMMYQKIIRRLKFRANRRGFYRIEQIDVSSTDLFMERHMDMQAVCNAAVYVYPGQADAARLLIPFQRMMGDILTKQYICEDPFEFQGIRPYEPFDSMRDVNWKASARTGELRTNIHGNTVRREVCLMMNLESESMMEYKQLKEESIRLANSLAGMFLAQGIPVGIYSNAKDLLSGKELHMQPGGDKHHLTILRENLARLDLSQPMREFGDLLNDNIINIKSDTVYIFISSSQRTEVSLALEQLLDRCSSCFWILPLHSWMEQKVCSVKNLSVIRWEVEQNAS